LVLVFFKRGAVAVDEGILARTALGIETRVDVGETVGHNNT
jgi:hypothetical protein